jgi:CP family cyanate transporter-like MFS transporter
VVSPTAPWLLAAVCLLLAANLRPALTSVGPVLGDIRAATGMSAAAAGLVTTVPLLALAAVSPLAARLGRRVGIERALLGAMAVLTIGLLVRSLGPTGVILAGTAVIGTAIAIGNVLLPGLIKQDFPQRAGVLMGLYSTTLAATAGVASGVSVPLAETGIGWRGALAAWAALSGAALVAWRPYARPRPRGAAGGGTVAVVVRLRGSVLAWSVTVFMGCNSLLFYALVTWLPTLLEDGGMTSERAGWMLGLMQIAMLPVTMVVPMLATRTGRERSLLVASTAAFIAGILGLLVMATQGVVIWIVLLGLGSGALFSLALSFLVLRAADARHVAALSGMAQSIGYLLAATGPIALGWLHDTTGTWNWPLAALAVVAAVALAAGFGAARDLQVGGSNVHAPRQARSGAARARGGRSSRVTR